MDLFLYRTETRPDGIFGILWDDEGERIAYTLEHAYGDNNSGYNAKIPLGKYTCLRGFHQLSGMDSKFTTFEVMGVPGHTGILFHFGNYNKDSDGCILLGDDIIQDGQGQMITQSRITFAKFMRFEDNCDQFTLTIDCAK